MELSEIFSFLTVLKESMTLLPKIWKITTPIALISLVPPSLIFLLFSYSLQIMTETTTHASDFKYTISIFAAEIVFVPFYIALLHLSGVSTIIASAMGYTDKRLSPSDLLCKVRQTWRKPFKLKECFHLLRKVSLGGLWLGVCIFVLIMGDMINVVTITLLVAASILSILNELNAAVSTVLAYVAMVVEEISDGTKAAERGEHLAEGQRLKGFIMNLFINLLACGCFLVFWVTVGDKGPLNNITIYGLFLVIFTGVMSVYTSVVSTVFYFQCRKHHGEEIDVVGDAVLYSKLLASSV